MKRIASALLLGGATAAAALAFLPACEDDTTVSPVPHEAGAEGGEGGAEGGEGGAEGASHDASSEAAAAADAADAADAG
jgi:hypothetical protein